MNSDLLEIIANLLIEDDPALEVRLECQDEDLNESACTAPVLGKWIAAYDVEYLLASFSLLEEDFAQMFPSLAHVPSSVRRQIVTAFEEHLEWCRHCWLKAAYDKELNALIDRVLLEESDRLLQLFPDGKVVTEDEEQCRESGLSDPVRTNNVWPKSVRFETRKFMFHPWVVMGTTAAAVVLLAVSVMIFHSQQQKLSTVARYQEEMSRVDQTNSKTNMQVVELTSMLRLRSSYNDIPRITIHATTAVVRFQLKVPVDEIKMTYNVAFSSGLKEVLFLRDVKRVHSDVSISMPARFLPVGDYSLTVSSDPDAPKYDYLFRVVPVQ